MPELSPEEYDLCITLGDISEKEIDYILFQSRFVETIGILGNHDPKTIPGLNDIHRKVVEINPVRNYREVFRSPRELPQAITYAADPVRNKVSNGAERRGIISNGIKGVKIGGIGGAQHYIAGHLNHYVEKQIAKWMKKMPPVDIFISHAPPFSVSLSEDRVHQGFKAFDDYIARFPPAYWFHGHLGKIYSMEIGNTKVLGITGGRTVKVKV